jgi:hypothetical protein
VQGQSLTAAEAGRQHDAVAGLEAVTANCLEQRLRLLGGEVTRVFALDGRAFNQGGRVADADLWFRRPDPVATPGALAVAIGPTGEADGPAINEALTRGHRRDGAALSLYSFSGDDHDGLFMPGTPSFTVVRDGAFVAVDA